MKLADMQNLRVVPLTEASGAIAIVNQQPGAPDVVPTAALEAALDGTRFGENLPPEPYARAALTRAVDTIRTTKRNADRLAGRAVGYQITDKTAPPDDDEGLTLEYIRCFSVHLANPHNRRSSLISSAPDAALSRLIEERYKHYQQGPDQRTIKTWLQGQIYGLGGVKLSDNGHVYFMPPAAVAALTDLRDRLLPVTGLQVALIGVGAGPDIVNAVLHGLTREAELLCAQTTDICFGDTGDLGPRARRTHMSTLEAMKTKLAKYAAILGTGLPDLVTKLDTVKQSIMLTVIAEQPDLPQGDHER